MTVTSARSVLRNVLRQMGCFHKWVAYHEKNRELNRKWVVFIKHRWERVLTTHAILLSCVN